LSANAALSAFGVCARWAARRQPSSIGLGALAAEFTTLASSLNFDAEQAEIIQTKMNAWLELKRKYGAKVEAVIAARDEMRRKLELQGDVVGSLIKLEKQIAEALKVARKAAAELRATREKAAASLEKTAGKVIVQLGFKKADFRVSLTPLPELGLHGHCGLEFLFPPNVREAPPPLHRIPSRGQPGPESPDLLGRLPPRLQERGRRYWPSRPHDYPPPGPHPRGPLP